MSDKKYYIEYVAKNMTASYHGHFNFWSDEENVTQNAIRYAKKHCHLDGLQVSITDCQVIDWNDESAEL